MWQAEHYVGGVRDHALSLACLRHGLPAVQARGYDDVPADDLVQFERTHIASLDVDVLRAALSAALQALIQEGTEANVSTVDAVVERLGDRV